ncbi:MAG: Snf7 family protein [Nitrosopumilus sp.]|uniref:Snf7 family protein n=1 Tax=Nitrosopumilus sp. TaxID=2024843 RepID=UPI00292F7203|nr:Snf7 family protein [Nitrosopumilus sp.]
MSNFGQSWQRPPSSGVSDRLQGLIKKEPPLKPRIEGAIKGLNRPISQLKNTSTKISSKEEKLFNKIVQAKQSGNIHAAKALANELVQLRKTNSLIGNMKLSVERTQLRLSTTSSIGDAIVSMQPAVSTMKAVVPVMNKIIPQASAEIESMGTMLGDMMPGTVGDDYSFGESTTSSQETDSILQEAAAVAETQIGNKFPSVPTGSSAVGTTVDSFSG